VRKVLTIVHQETSNPGLIGQQLKTRGFELDILCPALGQTLPQNLHGYEGVIVFGGPMSANDDTVLPFIRTELAWIPVVLDAKKPYLGICLGAQLLARVLGGKVLPRADQRVEIGYFPIAPTIAGQAYWSNPMHVYQWHQEGFELPSDTTLLATGETFTNQAFQYGDGAYGLQFHPEITRDMMEFWIKKSPDKLELAGAQPRADHFLGHKLYRAAVENWLTQFIDQWLCQTTVRAN